MFNQYASGADWWSTPTEVTGSILRGVLNSGGSFGSAIMDSFSADESVQFIKNYFSSNALNGGIKNFPALFSVYLSGLDHFAHVEGMSGYSNYFKSVTDNKIEKIVDALKDKGEFDNKIFVIVADHGETQMPVDLKFRGKVRQIDPETGEVLGYPIKDFYIDTSCSLKTNFKDPKDANQTNLHKEDERNNNNLHIWELGLMFQQLDPALGWRLLVPKEVEEGINVGLMAGEIAAVTSDINQANVIAALNGPMAHIYVKRAGSAGWVEPNNDLFMLGRLADILNMYFAENGEALSEFEKEPFPRLFASVNKILIRVNGSYKVFKGVSVNTDGNIIGLSPPGQLTDLETNQSNINSVSRIERMNHLKRSGDIVLLMNDDPSAIPENRYSTAYACQSWHGSLNKSDSFVPLIFAYPGGNKQEFNNMLTSICPNHTCEGNWVLSNLVKKIIEPQYSDQ